MIDAPRMSTLGEILDRTAHMYRSRFLLFLGTAAMPAGVVLTCAVGVFLFFGWMGTGAQTAPDAFVGIVAIGFLAVSVLIILPLCAVSMGLGAAALNHVAMAAYHNQSITIRGAYQEAWRRGWRYIWLLILQALVIIAAPIAAWLIVLLGFAAAGGVTGASPGANGAAITGYVLLLFLALAIYAVWMLLKLCLAFPACAVEKITAWAAVKRAASLSKGTQGRILILYLLGLVLGWGLSLVIMIPAVMIVSLVPGLDTPRHSQSVAMAMILVIYGGPFLARAFTKPVYVIAEMLFYFDQRIRKEGFDIEWMMRQAGMIEALVADTSILIPSLPLKRAAPELAGEFSPEEVPTPFDAPEIQIPELAIAFEKDNQFSGIEPVAPVSEEQGIIALPVPNSAAPATPEGELA